jgi:hypothetical protein
LFDCAGATNAQPIRALKIYQKGLKTGCKTLYGSFLKGKLLFSHAKTSGPLQTDKSCFFNTCHNAEREYSFSVKIP